MKILVYPFFMYASVCFRALYISSVSTAKACDLTVCLVAGWVGWVGSNPHFGNRANPFIVWLQL